MFHIYSSYTYFPYTTLFRSPCIKKAPQLMRRGFEIVGNVRLSDYQFTGCNCISTSSVSSSERLIVCSLSEYPSCETSRDRKSTRLNSSHVAISYAVFCFKKK